MAIIEDGSSPLSCVKCAAPFPPAAQFCIGCGATRGIALGQEKDAAQLAAEEEERREIERLRLEEEKALAAEKRRVRSLERKRKWYQHREKVFVAMALVVLGFIYNQMQTQVFLASSPDAIIDEYAQAVIEKDLNALEDERLFPRLDEAPEIAPQVLLDEIRTPQSNGTITINWEPSSTNATAVFEAWKFGIILKSDPIRRGIFEVHNWHVSTPAPAITIGNKLNAVDFNSEISGARLGSMDVDYSWLFKNQGNVYSVFPGTVRVRTSGIGFRADSNDNVELFTGIVNEVTFQLGSSSVPGTAFQKAQVAANQRVRTCWKASDCGYLSMYDFGIDYPWSYDRSETSDTLRSMTCSGVGQTIKNSTSAIVRFRCIGDVFRSVTWITDYYYFADDYDFDYGSAEFEVDTQVQLRYDTQRRAFDVVKVVVS